MNKNQLSYLLKVAVVVVVVVVNEEEIEVKVVFVFVRILLQTLYFKATVRWFIESFLVFEEGLFCSGTKSYLMKALYK